MDLIIDFYKELDTLNLIIFWGIIIIIILLLVFSFILIHKNKKLKKIVEQNNKYEEEIPIKEQIETEKKIKKEEKQEELLVSIEETKQEIKTEPISKPIEVEKKFIVEEHIAVYNQETDNIPKLKKEEENTKHELHPQKTIEIPNKPYQRNVLREMSLSQTSPIGINRQIKNEDRKVEMIKDLEETLNNNEIDNHQIKESVNEEKTKNINIINNQLKKELNNIEDNSNRKNEIILNLKENITESQNKKNEDIKEQTHQLVDDNQEILNDNKIIDKGKDSSEKYLEAVSKKLAAAEIPDEIERTNYELQQEEDAIISYKELMEKKDSIQTVDEEDAIISIEELMDRTKKQQEITEESQKLYNLTEEEATDNFIKELKQFRNDL